MTASPAVAAFKIDATKIGKTGRSPEGQQSHSHCGESPGKAQGYKSPRAPSSEENQEQTRPSIDRATRASRFRTSA